MAPSLRSGKGSTRAEVLAHKNALRAGIANTTGFPALPTELLLEITSYLKSVPVPMCCHHPRHVLVYPASYLEKHQILRAFSQMCRSLRSTFLPHVWRTIEVCASAKLDKKATSMRVLRKVNKELATELVRQLEIVTIRDPTLARYVRYAL
jgi:hypothetical protein